MARLTLLLGIFVSAPVFAQGMKEATKEPALNLMYPELTVSPLATQRLDMESKKERKRESVSHLPMEISAISTLAAGWYASTIDYGEQSKEEKDNVKYASLTGLIVGGGWLATSLYLQFSYRPYDEGVRAVAGLPNKTQSENLTRERLAEEALYRPGDLARKLKWLSVSTNLVAAGYIASLGNKNAALAGGLAGLAALSPLIFPYSWETTADIHRDYKKKIYGPLTQLGLGRVGREMMPELNLSWQF